MNRLTILLLSIFFIAACNEPADSGKSVQEIKADDIASIIRNPVSASEPIDPDFVPKMTFDESTYDFGSVKAGKSVEHTFKFKNTGEVPLLIGDASSTCNCTVPTYPKGYIQPGKGGEIKVIFDTKGLSGSYSKPVTIIANTYPSKTKLMITGIVEGKEHKH